MEEELFYLFPVFPSLVEEALPRAVEFDRDDTTPTDRGNKSIKFIIHYDMALIDQNKRRYRVRIRRPYEDGTRCRTKECGKCNFKDYMAMHAEEEICQYIIWVHRTA